MVAMDALPVTEQVVADGSATGDPTLATPRDGVGSDDPDFFELDRRGLGSEASPW